MADRKGLAIGVIGLILAIPGTLVALNELGTLDLFPRIFNPSSSPSGCTEHGPAEITLSAGTAKRGASVTVYGTCFDPGERVALHVHVEEVGSATADTNGRFTQTITIPASAPAPGFPTSIIATGRNSLKTATAPFQTAPS